MKIYAVIKSDGTIKWAKGRGLAIYAGRSTAQGQCKVDGDCVVELDVDLKALRPIFIRGRKLDGST